MTVKLLPQNHLARCHSGGPSPVAGIEPECCCDSEQSKHFGKSWKEWVAKGTKAIGNTMQIWSGCVRPRTHWPLTAISSTPTLRPCSGEDTHPKLCCHLLRTCSLSFLQDTSWQSSSVNYFLFLLYGLEWLWADPLKKQVWWMLN